jgi:hypothetical protein
MRTWIRWTTGIAGVLIVAIGLVATGKVLSPGSGLESTGVEGWMFEGPALVTFGLLLCWTAAASRTGGSSLEERAPRLLVHIGLAFLALPAATWAWNSASPSAASAYAWSFAAFALGVPGAALTLTGAALWSWRRMRERFLR